MGTSQQGGHRDHPRSHPRWSSRSGVVQPAQPGTGAPPEAVSSQASWHGCYHHPSTPGALPRPWAAVGERRPSPAHNPWDHHSVQLEGDTSAESQSHSQPFPCCQDIFPGAGQSFKAAGTIPWQPRLPSPSETGNGSHHPSAGAIRCQPAIQRCELPVTVPYSGALL